jgi:hypothetical protein
MQHDGARLEQGQVAVLIGRDLTERLQRHVLRRLHLGEGDQAHVDATDLVATKIMTPKTTRFGGASSGLRAI